MQKWNIDRLNRLIENKTEESTTLEYKRAASLVKDSDRKKEDLVKQVTAMANAAGGTIIYGIAEYDDKSKRHLPEKLDPIDRSEISKEWLDSIIHSIQPCVDGVKIYPVTDEGNANKVYYVIEVQQSHTAHQARDLRYYRRRNFQVQPMEDYEVREVMKRKSHPRIKASLWINKKPLLRGKEGQIRLKLENQGNTICQQYMASLDIPIDVDGGIWLGEKASLINADDERSFWRIALSQNLRRTPIFPGASISLEESFTDGSGIRFSDGAQITSTDTIYVRIYADEMPAIRATIDPLNAVKDWVEITPEEPDLKNDS
jgi:hypothetical protein